MNASIVSTTPSAALIGTAVPAETFVLLEVPPPWDKPALLSTGVPESLRQVIKPLLDLPARVRVHLIANEQTPTQTQRRILIFQQERRLSPHQGHAAFSGRLSRQYAAWETQVAAPAEMAPALDSFFNRRSQGESSDLWRRCEQRHLMVCTHASHNECCGAYGYPFYQAAIAQIQELGLMQLVQPWQITHIGGHRFAPTLIDFPQGRYYGNLNEVSLSALLQLQGDVAPLLAAYRGWSALPKPLQILETELLHQYGWRWFAASVTGRILSSDEAQKQHQVELWFKLPNQTLKRCLADVRHNQVLDYAVESKRELDTQHWSDRKTG
ncbi:MAG: sucrase ferredoxin [Leptolyngbyaceae cyanobacterium]